MMLGNKKVEGRVCTAVFHIIRKSQTLQIDSNSELKKSLSLAWDSNPACP